MITILAAASSLVLGAIQAPPTVCAVMGSPANAAVSTVDYAGVRYGFCCAGCPETFAKDPAKALKGPKVAGKTTGTFLFDPVSRLRVDTASAKGGWLDVKGTRYLFLTPENKQQFQKSPAKFTAQPAKESLSCPVSQEVLKGYAGSYSYQDFKGVRYYICCGSCVPKFSAEPAKYVGGVAEVVSAPKAFMLKAGEQVQVGCGDEEKMAAPR